MNKLELYYHTITHLNRRQLLHQLLHRTRKVARKAFGLKYSFEHYRCGTQLNLDAFIPKYESCCDNEFTFLNISERFNGTWDYEHLGALWSFNINYMEYLLQPSMTVNNGLKWINQFIDSQQGNKIGMSPYCVALRGVNWIKFVTVNRDKLSVNDRKRIDTSLYSQYKILLGNMEYNLAGNHLLEDLFSLLWCAFYFNDAKLFDRCAKELIEQLKEQTLDDGANYEQSPMYHCVILDRLLDSVNLLKNNRCFAQQDMLYNYFVDYASKMLGWLFAISYADGSYPLFNDAACGIAPTVKELVDYAWRLGVKAIRGESNASGYYCVDTPDYELRMDMGGIAASYIPGHSHADTFNFELRVGGKPFIVDTGISTYQWCARRGLERSTAAHNTVEVAGRNSSCVWAAFRCAERAKVSAFECGSDYVKASHNGYSKLSVVHSRKFQWDDNSIAIDDNLTNDAEGKAYFHFAPSLAVSIQGNNIISSLATISFEGCTDICIQECECSTRYNSLQKSLVAVVSFNGNLKSRIELI